MIDLIFYIAFYVCSVIIGSIGISRESEELIVCGILCFGYAALQHQNQFFTKRNNQELQDLKKQDKVKDQRIKDLEAENRWVVFNYRRRCRVTEL